MKNRVHDYQIIKRYCAGLVLVSNEIKSVAKGEVDLTGGYVTIDKEAWLHGVYIKPVITSWSETVARRPIKLLLNKAELRKLKGETIILVDFYVLRGKYKATIATATHIKKIDKRQKEKAKEDHKEMRGV